MLSAKRPGENAGHMERERRGGRSKETREQREFYKGEKSPAGTGPRKNRRSAEGL